MPGIEDFRPTACEYVDIDEVIKGGTAEDILANLKQIEATLREERGITGEIRYDMTPNSLCAMWTPEPVVVSLEGQETHQQKIERRRRAVYQRNLTNLSRAQRGLESALCTGSPA